MLDLLIAGAEIVDGTGADRRRGDVGVRGDRIVALGTVSEPARRTVDAQGLVVAPGFVDIHTHYDAQVFWDSAMTPSLLHGVTTVVGGNCGFTLAPIEPDAVDYLVRMLARVEGMPLQSLTAGVPFTWATFGQYLDAIEGRVAVNTGFLVGHCAVRRVVMREEAVGHTASPDELEAMAQLLGRSLSEGALGFSSTQATTHNDGDGDPVPSRSATRDELVRLCQVVAEHSGTTLEFIPTVGPFEHEHLELMADMSVAANRPLNWNVLVPDSGRADHVWSQLAAADFARERGGRVVALTIPSPVRAYLNFETAMVLDAIPGWGETMRLPHEEKRRALADPAQRRRLAEAAASAAGPLAAVADWGRMTIVETSTVGNGSLAGRRVADIAREQESEPFEALLDIVVDDDLKTIVMPEVGGDDDSSWALRAEVWRDPRTIVGGSDAGAHLDMLSTFDCSTTLLEAARNRDLISTEEAVRMLTDEPARLYGLRERGRIAEGWHADLVVFDEAAVAPGPVEWREDLPAGAGRLYSNAMGIAHVFVNGTEVVSAGELTGALPGTVLRSGRDTETVEAAMS